MKVVFAVAIAVGSLFSTSPTTAQEKCNKSKSCDEALGYCLEHRAKNKLTRAELPCESTGSGMRQVRRLARQVHARHTRSQRVPHFHAEKLDRFGVGR